ncbi:MAG TPA: ATP-binding protein [Dissulfurispiraceae bacterium]|nr:ATP-binding protein [Dissulfurispiraceae bacterium]
MKRSAVFDYYTIGRFILAVSLFIAVQVSHAAGGQEAVSTALGIYCIAAFVRLLAAAYRTHALDFVLDLVFVTVLLYIPAASFSFLSVLYLFPVFFSSLAMRSRLLFVFPALAAGLYLAVFELKLGLSGAESYLNLALHVTSFFLIAFAGNTLREKMARQELYIGRLEAEKIRAQGLERLYRVSADLAHELRNPLASLSAAVQFVQEGQVRKEFLDIIGYETVRLTKLVNDFLLYARPSDAPLEEVSLADVVQILVSHLATPIKIETRISEAPAVLANRTFVEAAVTNVLQNALEAAHSVVRISVSPAAPASGGLPTAGRRAAELIIEDDGAGVDASLEETLFEPFVTTKINGTGLGLAIAFRIVAGYGGVIRADRSALGGARFSIVLPAKE